MAIKEYKCPNCAGAISFDSATQKMNCPYCDSEFEIADLDDYQQELDAHSQEGVCWTARMGAIRSWEESDMEGLECGSCPSCGAELVGDGNTIAMVCPCCGNAQIVKARISGLLKPDWLIPFKLDRKAAVDALAKFCHGKRLLPNCFTEQNRVECVQGLYLPFWLFDAKARGHVRYRATKVSAWSDSQFNYTKTDHFSVVRDGTLDFEKVPVNGSDKMDDGYMDAIEPFDYAGLKDFSTAFLAGHAAEKFDVDAEKSKERAGERIKVSVEDQFARSVKGYSSVRVESSSVNVEDGAVRYSLFPVWVLNTLYKGKNHLFMMNGQTGLLAGRLPVDKAKCWKYRALIAGISGAVLTLGVQALRIFAGGDLGELVRDFTAPLLIAAWAIALALGFGIVHAWKRGMDTALRKSHACEYAVLGSLDFKQKKDRFLYSNVSRTRRQSAQGGGGGGSIGRGGSRGGRGGGGRRR